MEGKQNIYYSLGILAYAVAMSDGEIQEEERTKLSEIVKSGTDHDINFEYAEIIFKLLERDHSGFENTYNWAMEELKKGRHYLSPEIKKDMVRTMEDIAGAFLPVTEGESNLITRFRSDIETIGSKHFLK